MNVDYRKLATILRTSKNKHEIADGLVDYFGFDRQKFFESAGIDHYICEIEHIDKTYTLRKTYPSLPEAVRFLATVCHLNRHKQEKLFKLEPVQYGREGNWCGIGWCSCGDMNNHPSEKD